MIRLSFVVIVSIHAPAKGATRRNGKFAGWYTVSIHAPAKGATEDPHEVYNLRMFQSTLPRRERRGDAIERKENKCFNPRSREGSD